MFLKMSDPVANTAIAAVAASVAYLVIRQNLYMWFVTHTTAVFGIIIAVLMLMFAFFVLKFM